MNFGTALELIKHGQKVRRTGWNGNNMFLVLAGGYSVLPENLRPHSPITAENLEDFGVKEMEIVPHIDMWTAQKTYMTGWVPSQLDLFANDWELIK